MFYNYEVYYNKSIRQSIAYTNSTKIYLNAVEKKFNKFDKVKKKTLMKILTTTSYDGVSEIWKHIMELIHLFNKLKRIKVELADSFIVWQVFKFLSTQFNAFKITNNAQKDEWSLSEMTTTIVT